MAPDSAAQYDDLIMDLDQARAELACAFRWCARHNMHEGVANHFSLAVNDAGTKILLNPNGRHFSRMKASDLLLLDANEQVETGGLGKVDPTAWDLHGAIHRKHKHARCILHVHSPFATALASLKDTSFPPINQTACRYYERIKVDTGFDGMGLGPEGERCANAVDEKPVLLMQNHGVMVFAESVAEAYDKLYYFERACHTLINALQTGRDLAVLPHEIAVKTRDQWESYPDQSKRHFIALMEMLDEEEPDFRL